MAKTKPRAAATPLPPIEEVSLTGRRNTSATADLADLLPTGKIEYATLCGWYNSSAFVDSGILPMQEPVPAKVFISYSWSSDSHKEWVLRLAERLRADGVDVILDRWDLKEGQDTVTFMEQMVTDKTVTKVVAVCDRKYAEKADARRGGVGTESQIISKEVYDQVNGEKFIPVFCEKSEDGKPYLPVFFKSRFGIDFSDIQRFDENYDQLLRNLHGRPELKKPPLGRPPAHLFVESTIQVTTAGRLAALRDAFNRGRSHTEIMLRDYLDALLEAAEAIRVTPNSGDEEPPFYERLIAALATFTPYRDNYVEFIELISQHLDAAAFEEVLAPFFETLLSRYRARPEDSSFYNTSFDFDKFVGYELLLYTLSALVRVKKTRHAARLIEGKYTSTVRERFSTDGLDAFRQPVRSLEDHRKARLNLRWYSVTAELIRSRATLSKVPFSRLAEVDVVLFVRRFFPQHGGLDRWYPILVPYLERVERLELFARAVTERGFHLLKDLLKVSSISEFVRCTEQMLADPDFRATWRGEQMADVKMEQLLNLEELKRIVDV